MAVAAREFRDHRAIHLADEVRAQPVDLEAIAEFGGPPRLRQIEGVVLRSEVVELVRVSVERRQHVARERRSAAIRNEILERDAIRLGYDAVELACEVERDIAAGDIC